MALVGALLVMPMTFLALGEPISLKYFIAGIMMLPFSLLFALPIGAHFAAITILIIYITDRIIPLREKLKNKPSQRIAVATLSLLGLPLYFGLAWVFLGNISKLLDIKFFVFEGAIPAAISAAALGPSLISSVCRRTS